MTGLPKTEAIHEQLSPREFQVFLGYVNGKRASDIAREIHLSMKTVSTYRTRIIAKTGLDSVPKMMLYAVRAGLLT